MKVLEEIAGLASSKWGVFKSTMSLIKLEARLARLSAIHLLISVVILFIILITTWSELLALIGYGIYCLYPSPTLAITTPLLLNIILLIFLIKHVIVNIKGISFEKTRKFLLENTENDPKKAADVRNSSSRKEIAVSQD